LNNLTTKYLLNYQKVNCIFSKIFYGILYILEKALQNVIDKKRNYKILKDLVL